MKKESSFFNQVYEIAAIIPYGRVTSYGAIAHALGAKSSSRMVGYAMNDSHSAVTNIPAHRVVNRNGVLTGKHHFGDQDEMQRLLEGEGHKIIDNTIQNFKDVFWDPKIELSFDV